MKRIVSELNALGKVIGLSSVALFVAAGAQAAEPVQLEGSFLLFDTPEHVSTGCDIATQMHVGEVDKSGEVTVVLHQVVSGGCRIAVEPEFRVYKASVREIECGSRRFHGIRSHQTGSDELEVTDHRSRACRDFMPAQLEVSEINTAGVSKLFAPRTSK